MNNIDYKEIIFEAVKRQEILDVMKLSETSNLKPLFFKGTALAYSVYDKPFMRSRLDHDILLPLDQVEIFSEILLRRGYEEYKQLSIFNERCFFKIDRHGIQHVWDVHWKISNRTFADGLYTYPELYSRSLLMKFEQQASQLRRIGDQDQILITALHEVLHHRGEFNETSLEDGFRLFQRLGPVDIQKLHNLAYQKNLTSLLEEFSKKIEQHFNIKLSHVQTDKTEKINFWINNKNSSFKILWTDFCNKKTIKQKTEFLYGLIFPSKAYLEYHQTSTFGRWTSWLFPILQNRKVK